MPETKEISDLREIICCALAEKDDLVQYPLCRVQNEQERFDFYITGAQAIILSNLYYDRKELSRAERVIMASCPDRLISLKGEVGTATDLAKGAKYTFVKYSDN